MMEILFSALIKFIRAFLKPFIKDFHKKGIVKVLCPANKRSERIRVSKGACKRRK